MKFPVVIFFIFAVLLSSPALAQDVVVDAHPADVIVMDIVEPVDVADAVFVPASESIPDVIEVSALTPDAIQENIPIPQDDIGALVQIGKAIGSFGAAAYTTGVLLLIGVAVFVYRKFFAKKK